MTLLEFHKDQMCDVTTRHAVKAQVPAGFVSKIVPEASPPLLTVQLLGKANRCMEHFCRYAAAHSLSVAQWLFHLTTEEKEAL